jgi:arabinogalactan endo-1,4-beta-galactosidase
MVVLKSLTAVATAILSLSSFATASPKLKKPYFYNGFDLSSLKIQEDGGFIFKDTARNNATRPVEDILGDAGMNTVRLRLWVNPTVPYDGGYYETYDLEYTLGLAKRFSAKGYKIYLDYRECQQDVHIIFQSHPNQQQTSATTGPTPKSNGNPPPGLQP